MKNYVLDCLVTVSWFFEDEFNKYTQSVPELLLQTGTVAVVPGLWVAEVSNVMFQAERRKRISPENVNQALNVLSLLPIEYDHQPINSMGHVLHLSRKYTLTSYDALYMELALRRNIPLATQDKKMRASAKSLGVKLV